MSNDGKQEFISLVDENKVDFNTTIYDNFWKKYADVDGLKQQSILTYSSAPTTKQGNIIYVDPFGLMKWNEAHSIYRSVNCCQMVNGWNKNPADHGCVRADGANYSKTGGYTNGSFGRTGAPQGIDDFTSGTTFDAGSK